MKTLRIAIDAFGWLLFAAFVGCCIGCAAMLTYGFVQLGSWLWSRI